MYKRQFQTNLKFGEQKRVFSMIPGLQHAEFMRYGVMHRNTFLNAPQVLNQDFSFKQNPNLFFAGQITGVEGYMESASSGILAGINAVDVYKRQVPMFPTKFYCFYQCSYVLLILFLHHKTVSSQFLLF